MESRPAPSVVLVALGGMAGLAASALGIGP